MTIELNIAPLKPSAAKKVEVEKEEKASRETVA